MAKFIFNFEQLLTIKQKIEKQEQMNLGKAMQTLNESVDKLNKIEDSSHAAIEEFQMCIYAMKPFKQCRDNQCIPCSVRNFHVAMIPLIYIQQLAPKHNRY